MKTASQAHMGNSSSSSSSSSKTKQKSGSKGLSRFYTIKDNYTTVGKISNQGRCLHQVDVSFGPYMEVMQIIGKTLADFDDDKMIPCYGFGDGPTSFAPAIYQAMRIVQQSNNQYHILLLIADGQAMRIVQQSNNQYHILLLIADGQVTRPSGLSSSQLSSQERATITAIEQASYLPLSIVMVGVGDGPWDTMEAFDDKLPKRKFDNFQFVNYTALCQKYAHDLAKRETTFARNALMELPEQYQKYAHDLAKRETTFARNALMELPEQYQPMSTNTSGTRRHPSDAALPPTISPAQDAYYRVNPTAGAAAVTAAAGAPPPGGAYPSQPEPPPPPGMAAYQAPPMQAPPFQAPPIQGAPPGQGPNPDMYTCPISHTVMLDPVIAADGYTYERTSIEQWLSKKATSPMTNAPMDPSALIPNHGLRSAIMEWKQSTGA
eukprot:gene32734-33874_t